jgi:hypothetical protein
MNLLIFPHKEMSLDWPLSRLENLCDDPTAVPLFPSDLFMAAFNFSSSNFLLCLANALALLSCPFMCPPCSSTSAD